MAEKMTFAAVPANGDGEPVEVECEFDFGSSLKDAQAIHKEEDILYFFTRGAKGYLGMRARARIVAGDTPEQVREAVANADLSQRGRAKMTPLEKLMKQLNNLSDSDREAVIDQIS